MGIKCLFVVNIRQERYLFLFRNFYETAFVRLRFSWWWCWTFISCWMLHHVHWQNISGNFKTCIWLKMHWTFIYSLWKVMFKGFTHRSARQQNMHNVHSKYSSVLGGNFKEYAEHVHPCWRVNEPITKTSKFTVITSNFHKNPLALPAASLLFQIDTAGCPQRFLSLLVTVKASSPYISCFSQTANKNVICWGGVMVVVVVNWGRARCNRNLKFVALSNFQSNKIFLGYHLICIRCLKGK